MQRYSMIIYSKCGYSISSGRMLHLHTTVQNCVQSASYIFGSCIISTKKPAWRPNSFSLYTFSMLVDTQSLQRKIKFAA